MTTQHSDVTLRPGQEEVLRRAGANPSGYFSPMLHGDKAAARALRKLGLFENVTEPGDLNLEYRLTDAGWAALARVITEGAAE